MLKSPNRTSTICKTILLEAARLPLGEILAWISAARYTRKWALIQEYPRPITCRKAIKWKSSTLNPLVEEVAVK